MTTKKKDYCRYVKPAYRKSFYEISSFSLPSSFHSTGRKNSKNRSETLGKRPEAFQILREIELRAAESQGLETEDGGESS